MLSDFKFQPMQSFSQLLEEQPEFKVLNDHPIAYFCAEFALYDNLPIFSGGLGVLAGDVICEAGDSEVPLIGVGLLYKEGFFEQVITEQAAQKELPAYLELASALLVLLVDSSNERILIKLPIADRIIYAQIWEYKHKAVRLFLLDTDVEQNSELDRRLTVNLYPTDSQWRIQQEMILGIGGVRIFEELGIEPSVYHLNEGHSAFAVVEIAHQYIKKNQADFDEALKYACSKTVFTNHTLIPAGNDLFNNDEVAELLSGYTKHLGLNPEEMLKMGSVPNQPGLFSMTMLALSAATKTSAVSMAHSVYAKNAWPEHQLIPITNGVNKTFWQNPAWEELDKLLQNQVSVPDEQIWQVHKLLKQDLFTYILNKTGVSLKPEVLTLTWARRFTEYKQPKLIFSDVQRLVKLIKNTSTPIQIIFSGKAHPNSVTGKQIITDILQIIKSEDLQKQIVFIPNYDLEIAHLLTAGSDVWLNTPIKGQEACGTSGMKAGMNGLLQFAISDGWTDEINLDELGFWIDPVNSSTHIYEILELKIIPLYYQRNSEDVPEQWVSKMKATMLEVGSNYNSNRMLMQYLKELYFPIISKDN